MELCWRIYGPLRTLSHVCFYVFFIVVQHKSRTEEWKKCKEMKNSLKLIDIHVVSLNITDFMVALKHLSLCLFFYFSASPSQACANHPLLLWYLSFSLIFSHLMFSVITKHFSFVTVPFARVQGDGYFKNMFYSGVQTFFLTLFLAI
jgi:hypothetical protein